MAISRSLTSGVTGLRNHQTYMDVTGNNIANVNTIGFKGGRVTFEEVFALVLQGASRPPGDLGGINPIQIGLGSAIASIDTTFNQGTLESTGNTTDLALQGDGFFILSDGVTDTYSRSGAFQWDSGGALVSPNNGAKVQGWVANTQGVIPTGTPITNIVLPFGQKSPAKATENTSFVGNLSANEAPDATITRTKNIYALEKSTSGSSIQGLLARDPSSSDTVLLQGITENTTTVTLVDGEDRNSDNVVDSDDGVTFTFVETNTASNLDFHSIKDLADGITAYYTANENGRISATVDTDGRIAFTTANNYKLDVISTNSNLQRALETAEVDNTAGGGQSTSATMEFSHVAQNTDLMTDLRNSEGDYLFVNKVDENDRTTWTKITEATISIDGKVGGVDIVPYPTNTNAQLSVDTDTTLATYLEQLRLAYDIRTGTVKTNSAEGGRIEITGDGGTANEITAINIAATDGTGNSISNFNSIFDSTPNNWLETQTAKDVTVSASATVYDSLGQEHVTTLTFKKDVRTENKWTWSASVSEPATTSGGNTGYATFNSDGSLASFVYDGASDSLQFEPNSGALNPVSIKINAGTLNAFNGITQLGVASSLVSNDQDGFGLGELDNISIDNFGQIQGFFTNGTNQLLGRLALATFNNPSGLIRAGDNGFVQTANSGSAIIGAAQSSLQTKITPGALEQSNVDLATEFTNLIIAQRGYQASARVITVSDQLLTEVVNLKT